MDENKNHINNRLSEQLPSHSPDTGTWQRLSDKLDSMDSETAYYEKLQGLPVHSPDEGTWNLIYSRLSRIAYYKTGIRIALSAAAGLLLFFTVSRISDQYQNKPDRVLQVASQEKHTKLPGKSNPVNTVETNLATKETKTRKPIHNYRKHPSDYNLTAERPVVQEALTTKSESAKELSSPDIIGISTGIQEPGLVVSGSEVAISETGNQKSTQVVAGSDIAIPGKENINIPKPSGDETPLNVEMGSDIAAQNTGFQDTATQAKEIINSETEIKSILFQKEQYATTSPVLKYNDPVDSKPINNKNHFALAMNYLPENIDNGTKNSLFHNVDVTASYNKEKVRFNTSFGMAYNEEQIEFNVNYAINTPVTAFGQGGNLDTLSYSLADMNSQYTGNERHQYFTYNLGLGRKLFSSGKFSTWVNLGAGFGILLNNPDLIASTENSVKSQYNVLNVSVSSAKPVYNDVNVNVVTAIDFNYKILNRLSITFTPTSRWYLKPVLSLESQSTDKLTLGFKTGMKFDF
ncbi:MAG: hypothetical protein Q7U54_19970 [Bacteroidales bacterium]|nr:hypothetical protein [Bacteroidales bacterium]